MDSAGRAGEFVDADVEDFVYAAGELAQTQGLRGYDAVHLAAAMALADDELVLDDR